MRTRLRPDTRDALEQSERPRKLLKLLYCPPLVVNNVRLRVASFYFDAAGAYRGGLTRYRLYLDGSEVRKGDLGVVPFFMICLVFFALSLRDALLHWPEPIILVSPAFVLGFSFFTFLRGRADSYLGPYFLSQLRNVLAYEKCATSIAWCNRYATRSELTHRGFERDVASTSFMWQYQVDGSKLWRHNMAVSVVFHLLSVIGIGFTILYAYLNREPDGYVLVGFYVFACMYLWKPSLKRYHWTGVRGFEEKTSSERRAWQGFDGPSELRLYEDRLEHLWEEQLTTIQRERIVRIERHDPRERWWWLKPACLRVVLLDDEGREAHYILLDVDPSDEELAQLNEWARGNAPDERAGGDAGSATMSEALDRLEDEYLR